MSKAIVPRWKTSAILYTNTQEQGVVNVERPDTRAFGRATFFSNWPAPPRYTNPLVLFSWLWILKGNDILRYLVCLSPEKRVEERAARGREGVVIWLAENPCYKHCSSERLLTIFSRASRHANKFMKQNDISRGSVWGSNRKYSSSSSRRYFNINKMTHPRMLRSVYFSLSLVLSLC